MDSGQVRALTKEHIGSAMVGPPTNHSARDQRWIQRDFLREKLRVRERYWRPITAEPSADGNKDDMIDWIIPDGLAWRTYLPLIAYLVEREEQYHKSNRSQPKRRQRRCRWVLLESVVEWMDYRNMSSRETAKSGYIPPEMASPHERSKIQRLMRDHGDIVKVFCDTSVREGIIEEDEWDLMQYDCMTMSERAQNSIFRAGRLLRQYRTDAGNECTKFFILSGDPDFVQQFPEEDGMETTLMVNLLETLFDRCHHHAEKQSGWLDDDALERAKKLAIQCHEDYRLRNDSNRSNQTASSIKGAGVEEYWTEARIEEGLRDKTLVKGKLSVTKENFKEGVVLTHGTGSDSSSLFINQNRGYFNRAFHEDTVIVQMLPKEEWTSPVGRRRLVHVHSDENEDTLVGNVDNTTSSDSPVPSGRVVGIASQSRRRFVATMVDTPMADESACLVVPMDARIPKIRIKTNGWRQFLGHRLWIQVDNWEVGSNYPSGRCIEILGPIADLETEITCLLKENQIFLEPFSAAAQACLPLEGNDWEIPREEISRRKDLRSSRRIFSVDPNGCQDIDDTFHAHRLQNGDIEIGVHIADVTHFVPHGSPLDTEARERATTFYLVDRRFDMLPSVLSSNLCSLHGNVDRLAVSTIWTLSSDLKTIKDFWYGRTVIRNCQAMTYEQAHNILHDKHPDDLTKPQPPPLTAGYRVNQKNIKSLKGDLLILTKIARKLRKDREDDGGAVDLSSGDQGNELKFTLDENHNPVKVTPKKQLEIHQTVAELMIMANTWVAKTIHERFPTCALLRIHRNVDESRFEDLKDVLNAGKISFDGSSNMRLANSLKKAEKSSKSSSAVNALFQSLATRAMSEAQYVSTGKIAGTADLSHYGLGLGKYTHFTSPIRRYADVVVHRQLLDTITMSKKEKVQRPPPGFERKALFSLPNSETISIIRGEGIDGSTSLLNTAVKSAQEEGPTSERIRQFNQMMIPTRKVKDDTYSNGNISKICETLNRQNRMAKMSSFECQSLFLSLYFKDHVETTQAVVTNLRSNGFWVYIPKFDFRAPVYLSDKEGVVQMDPTLLNLEKDSGLDPTTGFASSKSARRFPSGTCRHIETSDDDHLEIQLCETTKTYEIRILDVVSVNIFCDEWDTRSRVPKPRVHLISDSMVGNSNETKIGKLSRDELRGSQESSNKTLNPSPSRVDKENERPMYSVYEVTEKLDTPTNLSVDFRSRRGTFSNETEKRTMPEMTSLITGRMVFGNFVNPDTRSAQQEASIREASAAALERRNQAEANRMKKNEYDMTRRIESDVTARMQRLAASKRNTKRGKS